MTVDVTVGRTAAATAARQRRAARRLALELAARVQLLDDEVLAVLVAVVANEAARRCLDPAELFVE